jgi:hypothetical protein
MTTPVTPDATPPRAEPADTLTDPKELLAGYLDYYRATILGKLEGMSEEDLRSSRLPSGSPASWLTRRSASRETLRSPAARPGRWPRVGRLPAARPRPPRR